MKRESKYPDTKSFHYFNANPKNRITADCAYRAISYGLNQDYNCTVMEMAQMMCATGYASDDSKGIANYLEKKGWYKQGQPRHAKDNTKYTGDEFCAKLTELYPNGEIGKVVANLGGHHIVCIAPISDNGKLIYKIHDIWNSSDGCIGNFWSQSMLYDFYKERTGIITKKGDE